MIDECDGIDGSLVLVVLLRDFVSAQIILNDASIVRANQEHVLFFLVWVESYTDRHITKALCCNTSTGFRIPKLDLSVVAGRQKPMTIIGKCNITDRIRVAQKCSQTLALVVYVPQLDLCIHTGTKSQMPTLWEQTKHCDPFRVPCKGVNAVFRKERLAAPWLATQVHIRVCRNVQVCSSLIVVQRLAVENALFCPMRHIEQSAPLQCRRVFPPLLGGCMRSS